MEHLAVVEVGEAGADPDRHGPAVPLHEHDVAPAARVGAAGAADPPRPPLAAALSTQAPLTLRTSRRPARANSHRIAGESPRRIVGGAPGRVAGAAHRGVRGATLAAGARRGAGRARRLGGRRCQLLLDLIGGQAQDLSRGHHVPLGAECGVGHRQDTVPLAHMNLHLGVHARPEQTVLVVDADQHRKDRDVLLDLRLRLDLEHGAVEGAVGEGVHRDGGVLPRLDLADVGLVHQRVDLDQVQVGHLEQRGPAAHVGGGRGDHRPALDVQLDDGPGHRGPDIGVFQLDLGVVDRHLRIHDLRLGVGIVEQRRVVLFLGDRPGLEQLVGAALLAGGVGELGLGHIQVGLGLGQRVLRVARIDVHQQRALLDQLAGLGAELEHLARRLRLDFHGRVGLNGAGGLGVDDDVAPLDRDRLVDDLGHLLLAAGEEGHD